MRAQEPQGAELSMPELMHQLSDQTVMLVRQELELMKAEIGQKGKTAGKTAGLFAASSVFGIAAFGALTLTFIAALAYVVALWLAALIVAVVYALVAAVAATSAKAKLKQVGSPLPQRSVESLRDDVSAVRQGVEHRK